MEKTGIAVLDEVAFETAAPPPPKEKETTEDIKKRARKPPADGPCKGCGENRPLNRLMLCYKCWVKKELEKSGWKEGQSHPDWCKCEGLGEHRSGNGMARGLN